MKKLIITFAFPVIACAASTDLAPSLQWVKTAGGSGVNTVTAATGDGRGNLYITGYTTSLDFPTMAAAQATPGGSTLARVNLASATYSRLYPGNLPSITAIATDPTNAGVLYAASNNQLLKSADAGTTWTALSQLPASTSIFGLAVDPSNPNTLYSAGSPLGVQKSNDGGVTWAAINSGVPRQTDGTFNVSRVWVDPSTPSTVFAGGNSGLLRSVNGGGAWSLVTPGGSFNALAFDTLTPGTLYYGNGNTILKSADHGATWTQLAGLPNQAGVIAPAADPRRTGVLYAGSTGGLYRSADGGVSWTLQLAGVVTTLAADPSSGAMYANAGTGIVRSSDGFSTTTAIGPKQSSITQLLVAGPTLFAISTATTDAFAMKLDNDGNVVYATYFGGNGNDQATALAVGADGSLYIAGSTSSSDLPVTPGVYLTTMPVTSRVAAGFAAKLSPSGSLQWATYFPESNILAIATDSSGEPFLAGYTSGELPTTPGAYQTDFQQTFASTGFFSVPGPTSAFVTKFNAQGSALTYSTYVPIDNNKNVVQAASTLAIDQTGNAWFGVTVNSTIAAPGVPSPAVVELNSTGSAVVASAVQTGLGNVSSLAFDSAGNVYVAGSYAAQNTPFPATPGAFQIAPQPAVPKLMYQNPPGGGLDAFVAKWDKSLTHLLAATLLGGELQDAAASVAVDASGDVIVGGLTASKAFPTHAPFQESFSPESGFVAAFDANLSTLLFSTYLGDSRPFAAYAAIPDGNGNVLVAGSTLASGTAGLNGAGSVTPQTGTLVVANKIALPTSTPVRLDSVQNYASHIAGALTAGEPILALGSGFGNDAQILLDGLALTTLSGTATSITAVVPDSFEISGAHTLQVSSNGTPSNAVYMPATPAAPGIYTTDGTGSGQGYILNSDGTLNSPTNPAAPGSPITIFVAGEGPYTLTSGYAMTPQPPSVYIDGFYCNGIAAIASPVSGLPGNVYQLGVFVPDLAALLQNYPDLKNFTLPSQSSIQVAISGVYSQSGVFINIK